MYRLIDLAFVFSQLVFVEATLPSILWDPRNYLFSCNNLKINVRPNSDDVYFICPKPGLNTKLLNKEEEIYEKIYILKPEQKEQYDNCISTDATLYLNCDDYDTNTLDRKQELFPVQKQFNTTFVMEPGKTYYLLSTSERTTSTIDQRTNGSCRPSPNYFPLKMAIYLCTEDEVKSNNCPVCDTFDCYLKGCGVWSNWVSTSEFYWNGTECLEKQVRNCTSKYGTCEGVTEQLVAADKDKCVLYKETCVSTSSTTKVVAPSPTPSSCPTIIVPTTIYQTTTIPPTKPSTTVSVSIKSVLVTATASLNPLSCTPTTIVKTSTFTLSASKISCTKSTITITTTLTHVSSVTKRETVTVTEAIQGPVPPAQVIDIEYDKKFYITVGSAIIGALLVGIFVLHAIVSYCEGNRIRQKVISYSIVESPGSAPKVEFIKET